jgi:hypothetical protein
MAMASTLSEEIRRKKAASSLIANSENDIPDSDTTHALLPLPFLQ